MSLILEGVDLPKGGEKLKIEIEPDGTVWIDRGSEWEKREGGAVQILRPHGRLIDGDRLLKKYEPWLHAVPFINNTDIQFGKRVVLIDIIQDLKHSAPTILRRE